MAWVKVTDDGIGATPETYTDADGEATQMLVFAGGGKDEPKYDKATGRWKLGDDSKSEAEVHFHFFTYPVEVLRIDISKLDDGDYTNLAYEDIEGNLKAINLTEWIANGDAVVNLGSGHTIKKLPANQNLVGVQGSNSKTAESNSVTQIELYFPVPITTFYVGRNIGSGKTHRDGFDYELYYDDHDSLIYPEDPDAVDVAICFTSGTLIKTDSGEKPVEVLTVGDSVWTLDHGYQKIRWIGATKIPRGNIIANPKLLPVRIKAGALGQGLPRRDLVVSRQHRILVRSTIAEQLLQSFEVLVPAIKLIELEGISVDSNRDGHTFWHMLFDQHEIIYAEGAPTESLLTGPQALKSLSDEARREIEMLFPQILEPDFTPSSARLIPQKGSQIRELVTRHANHSRKLLSDQQELKERPIIAAGVDWTSTPAP